MLINAPMLITVELCVLLYKETTFQNTSSFNHAYSPVHTFILGISIPCHREPSSPGKSQAKTINNNSRGFNEKQTHQRTLNHALLVEHEEVAAAVQDGASFHSQVGVTSVLLLL